MERVIRFRGKRHDNIDNDWVYGFYFKENGRCFIDHYPDGIRHTTEVKPESVGMFTGLLDKSGKEIYEGDIMSVSNNPPYNHPIKLIVLFNEDLAFRMRFIDRYKNNEGSFYDEPLTDKGHPIFDVTGNIYENPELLSK